MICPNCKSDYSSICLKCGYNPKLKEAKLSLEDLGISEAPHLPMEKVHIWLASFSSKKVLDAYFNEAILDDDDKSMNRFASDQGEAFYDHDWVEISFNKSGNLSIFIRDQSYSSNYSKELLAAAEERNVTCINTFIMADTEEFSSPCDVSASDFHIWYMGEFNCRI